MLLQLLLVLQAAPDSAAIASGVRAGLAAIPDSALRATLDAAYAAHGHRLLWLRDRQPTSSAKLMIRELTEVAERGLRPSDYPAAANPFASLASDSAADSLAARDIALSRDAVRLVHHLSRGRVTPTRGGIPSAIPRRSFVSADAVLALAMAPDPGAVLDGVEPQDPAYWKLRALLPLLRALGATVAPMDVRALPVTLKPGERHPQVPAIRTYLLALGDAEPDVLLIDPEHYDDALAGAVEHFQRRHGLAADGVIGPATRTALAVPQSWRARQAELTLERWRWFAAPGTDLFVEVNVPDARLRVVERDTWTAVFEGAAVVGTVRTPTPLLSSVIPRIVFNPPWNVPTSIARDELIPKFRADSTAFALGGYELVQGGAVIPMTAEGFDAVGRGVLLRQRPGPQNALGRLKLDVVGNTGIYLHDTPSRASFGLAARFLSHGCVRVEQPVALAVVLLGADWNAERISRILARNTTSAARLERPVEVRLMYATVVVDEAGKPAFRPDPYGWDVMLDKVLP
jgi:murein L,D-transpeptidase YcbB/YkuD